MLFKSYAFIVRSNDGRSWVVEPHRLTSVIRSVRIKCGHLIDAGEMTQQEMEQNILVAKDIVKHLKLQVRFELLAVIDNPTEDYVRQQLKIIKTIYTL